MVNLPNSGYNNGFLAILPKSKENKSKNLINWDFIKFKNSGTSKNIIKKLKRQSIGQERDCTNLASVKGINPLTYEELP